MIVYSKMIVTTNVVTNNTTNIAIVMNNTTNVAIVTNVITVTVETNVLLPTKKGKVRNEIPKTNLEPIL